jgi:hypothetical protein
MTEQKILIIRNAVGVVLPVHEGERVFRILKALGVTDVGCFRVRVLRDKAVSGRDYVLGVVCHPITVVDDLEVITAKEHAVALAPRKIATTEEMIDQASEDEPLEEGGAWQCK